MGGNGPALDPEEPQEEANRATTNPKAITAIPVRSHASMVRSAAKYTRGSADGSVTDNSPPCPRPLAAT